MKYNVWENLMFLSGIRKNRYGVKPDARDFWRYVWSLTKLTFVQIPRIILVIPATVLWTIIVAFSFVTAIAEYLYNHLLDFMRWLPLPTEFHDRMNESLTAKYRLRTAAQQSSGDALIRQGGDVG